MTFAGSIASGFRKYAVFEGRASRSEYWWWTLFSYVTLIAAKTLDVSLQEQNGIGLFYGICALILLLPGLAVAFRRLHDTDHSGWWYWIIFTVIGLIPFFIWICTRGTAGPNRYGDDPLGGRSFESGQRSSAADYEGLERLANLRDRGAVTESEFLEQKARLLGSRHS